MVYHFSSNHVKFRHRMIKITPIRFAVPGHSSSRLGVLISLLLFFSLWLIASKYHPNQQLHLEIIKERGWLIVATRNGPTTYYHGSTGPAGLEYDLARSFADELGVELEIVVANSIAELNRLLLAGEVDLVASGMPTSVSNLGLLRYSSVYQQVLEQVIDRQNTRRVAHQQGAGQHRRGHGRAERHRDVDLPEVDQTSTH